MSFCFLEVLAIVAVTPPTVVAPVTNVTVYSDRAHVTRTAIPPAGAEQTVVFPLLPETVDKSTISVGATGGAVARVDIARVGAEEFPRGEAKKLLAELDAIDDQIAKVRGERTQTSAVFRTIEALSPRAPSDNELKPVPKLNATGWGVVLGFVEAWTERLQGALRAFDEKLIDLHEARAPIAERAELLGVGSARSGTRVTVTLGDRRPTKLALSYVAHRARWYPTYDIQFLPDRGEVELGFAGLVSQETGEDWVDATIVLSTAIPATSMVFPKLLSWKIGERERFIPTPTRVVEPVKPPPAATPRAVSAVDIDGELRKTLLARAARVALPPSDDGYVAPAVGADAPDASYARPHFGAERRRYEKVAREHGVGAEGAAGGRASRGWRGHSAYRIPAPAAAAPPPTPPAYVHRSYDAPQPTSVSSSSGESVFGSVARFFRRTELPTEGVGLAPPPGYVRPTYAPNLPVSLAGGYDLTFKSARVETIESGKGARRVALLTERWPVTVERRLYPAIAPDAFLVAELKNPSSNVLPGGAANLFVGADPAGIARLKLVAPGEPFTLPLGIDRALKPVRNVRLNTTEKGLFSKDEVTEYIVTIEVANPYKVPVATRIFDQMPVTTDKEVELTFVSAAPAVTPNAETGALEWRVEIPAAGKSVLTFTYTLRRPKGYRLQQTN